MLCISVVLCYVPSVALDLYLSRSDYIIEKTYKLLKSIEKQRAEAFDIQYRNEKLAQGFFPLFYPNLIRAPEGSFTKLAKKYDVAPLAPQPNKLVYYCNEGYGLISYKSDRYGFRNSDDVWDKKDKTFLIGDSFVQGACIPSQDQTITGYLSTQTNAINLGTGSNGPIHYAAITRAIVNNFDAKNVVMVFYPNDNELSDLDNAESYFYDYYWKKDKNTYLVRDGADYILNPDLVAFYDAAQDLLLSKLNLDVKQFKVTEKTHELYELSADEARKFIVKKFSFFDAFSFDNLKLEKLRSILTKLIEIRKTDLPFSSKLAIDELEKLCRERCNSIVVYIPNSELWRPDSRAESYRRNLQEYANGKGVTFLDTTGRLRSLTNSEVYAVKGPHLSPKGYEVVSEVIGEAIRGY
jgi:hypothetical protein